MKKAIATVIATAFLVTSAQAVTFSYTVDFSEPVFVGGMGEDGRQGRGGTMTGRYSTSFSDGTSAEGEVTCVGMDQPDNSLFDVHLACDAKDDGDEEGVASIIYGCNYMPGDAGLGCVGGMQAKGGEQDGARGNLTLHLKEGTSVGTGQWFVLAADE